MSSFEIAYEKVKRLVEYFSANEKQFLSPDYSEASVRTDFIDKFFDSLGWDVYHNEQRNPYEQEVKIEKGIYVGKQQKRADYAFHLAPNFRDIKFYVEAKKPSRNLSNADDYFQSIRYGWNAGTQITFLTDFEGLHILDCRIKPDISSILNYKIKQYHYLDYLNEEKFSEIYWLLSREAVANNSLEKFAESLPKPKGKAILKGTHRGIYQSIDEAFLEELDEMRDSLAKAFKKANPHLESEPLTEMIQRMIDRLVFIRFLEDKQIEPDHYVSEFANSKSPWKDFKIASRKLDAKYNGVVFKKHTIDSDNFIAPDNETFSLICERLAHLNSPYNFDIIPIHILGSIYERFLGKVVIATDKRVRIEEKPEVRKAGGVYYTPQYIVNYIVDNTVGKLIEGKTPKEISGLRFADISCGSGSFLITVFDRLLEHHRKWYQDNPEQAKKDGCYFLDGKWVLSLKQKQKILTNNIYGVDLDHQAVEVTQLSLYLKLLEDETTATTQDTWVMFKEQLLPNLNNNIVCGNSLIGTDILENNLFNNVETRHASSQKQKRETQYTTSLQQVDELKLKPMNFEDAFPEVMGKGGFEAIVGNPPYVNLVAIEETQRKYFQRRFKTCRNKSDLYSFFIEKSIELLKEKDSKLGYIVPHTWLATDSFKPIRELLLNNQLIEKIVELGFGVFKRVIVSTVVLICSPKTDEINVLDKDFKTKFKILRDKYINNNYHIDLDWNPKTSKIYEKLFYGSRTLDKIIHFSRGIKTSNDDRFIALQAKNKEYKKVYRGRNIKAYQLNWNGEYVWYRPDLMKEKVGCLPHSKEFFEVPEKLITQRVNSSMQLLVAYDNEENYFLDTTNVSRYDSWDNTYSLKYICGLMNSKLITYWYCNNYKMPTIGLYEIHSIPIHEIDFNNENEKTKHNQIVTLVDQMLESKKQLANTKTENEKEYLEKKCAIIDKQIDQLVYELYELTDEEIKLIENSLS